MRALLFVGVFALPVQAGRYDDLVKKYANNPDQAKVLAASCVGGAGTEWFVSGGFQSDGTIVVAGVSLGPTLNLAGVKETVLGKDSAAPGVWSPKPSMKNGKVETNKDGTPKLKPAGWNDEVATAFVVRLSPDAKKVLSVSRFPWSAGGVTSAVVDAENHIYLAGPARDGILNISSTIAEEKVGDTGAKPMACDHTYLAKLSPDATKVVWLKHFKGPSAAPDLDLDKTGKLTFQSQDLRTYDLAGKLLRTVVIPGGINGLTAIHPTDGTYARGGEHHWQTGREPYRDPILNIHQPDGKVKYEFYNWDGPYVGLDNLRLVSDSAVRAVKYDDDGNLIVYAWSDGGNSVMYREPYDVRKPAVNFKGLGMSAWGAGVLSCAYVIKLDPKTYSVVGGTLWLAFLQDKDKPNSIWIDTLGFAGEGSVCFAGSSAWGLIRTGNMISDSEPTGPYVAVLNQDCSSLRFCSTMPACGKVDVNNGAAWGIVRGKQKGRNVLLYLTGALASEMFNAKQHTPPNVNAMQPNHAGGTLDGYLLLLDLDR